MSAPDEQNPASDEHSGSEEAWQAERNRLEAALAQARNSAVENWAESAAHESASVAALKRSLSWRVTAPLRAVRTWQIRVTGSRR